MHEGVFELEVISLASLTVHLTIAVDSMRGLQIAKPEQFLLGAIAPDSIPSSENAFTHYAERISGRPYYRWEQFLDEYAQSDELDYVLGYLCHLITDEEWDRYVRHPLKARAEYMQLPDRRERTYAEMSRLDILVRPDEPTRQQIAKHLSSAVFPGLPDGLNHQSVIECIAWVTKDLFKNHTSLQTEYIGLEVVESVIRSACLKTVRIARLLTRVVDSRR